MKMDREPIGVLSTGLYIPNSFVTSQEIGRLSGLPQDVVEEKLGILRKPVPGEQDHSCEMGIRAARQAVERAQINPTEIDLVIYIGEEYKEYPVWTASLKLQQEIGALNAWSFDAALRCCSTVMALNVACSMMRADPSLRTVLLAGGYRNGDLVDYRNPRTRFLLNLGAGGGAILLRRGLQRNQVLESHLMTDASLSEDVLIAAGGTKNPLTAEEIKRGRACFDVPHPERMKQRLEQSMDRFLTVIRHSLAKSGVSGRQIDYLAVLHMKKSAHDQLLQKLGLDQDNSIYLNEYGHIGQFDQILSLELAAASGKLKDGDLVVLVSAGIGYAWGATTMKWGEWNE
ncbi:3-oxoacyl-ACP synthase [Brevibacillus humidisoli]|uniref:3-oxoacyl-ACP synthase n=1 Tax=Brevibacillus humidisoli TaxID=2895522 RepID=UPI001E40A2F2|nr:3-oxoacyl-ACP synthase [Brevibacillus humidisoli]UFJ42550.1 3-oxoacyl-ACP synthase [Brevibacillus humidisoli]